MEKKKIGVISLGCDKNRVDAEKMMYNLGTFAELTNEIEKANIIVINTRSFLCSSRKEAIDTILECNALREGELEKIVVTGCLPQKFISELYDELPEVDLFLGTNDYDLLFEGISEIYKGKRLNLVGKGHGFKDDKRVLSTPSHYAYLKVADGCNNRCSYCLIPYIRGKFVSTPIESLKEEVKSIGEVEELILVAQDLTMYGTDIYKKPSLVRLVRELSSMQEVKSIRLLYCYPELIDEELISEFKTNEKLIKYIDIPLQHADEGVLKAMNRRGNAAKYLKLIKRLQDIGVAIRSTFIAGFPGESEEAFENLVNFIKEAKLFNAGFFAYSREKGTPSYGFSGQIPQKVKNQRVKTLYKIQKAIVEQNLSSFVGKTLSVLCDGVDYDVQSFYGRAYFNAPDVDGKVYFNYDDDIVQGRRYLVKIKSIKDYDLYGEVEHELT